MDQFSCPDPNCKKRFSTHLTMRIHKQEVHDFLDFQSCPQCMFCKLKFKSTYIGTHVQVCPVRALKVECDEKRRRSSRNNQNKNKNKKNKKDNKKTNKSVAIEKIGFVDDVILLDQDQVKVEQNFDFGCQFCNFLAQSQLALDEHCRAHHTPADFRRCIYCGMSFENDELAQHLTNCLQDSLAIKCPKCQLSFLTYDLCMAHQIIMHTNAAQLENSKSKNEMKTMYKDNANSLKLILKLKPKPTTTTTTTTTTSVLKIRNGSKNADFGQLMTSSPSSIIKKGRKSCTNYSKSILNPNTPSAGRKLNNSTISTTASSKKKYTKKSVPPEKMKQRKMKFNCPAPNCRKKYEARGLMKHLSFAHQWKKSEGSTGGAKPKKNILYSEICPYPGCKKKLQENHLKLHMSLNHCIGENGLENGNNFGFTNTKISTDINMELQTTTTTETETDKAKSSNTNKSTEDESTVQATKTKEFGFVSCRLCKAVVISFSSHIRRHHNPLYNNSCNICGKRFQWENDLGRHIQIHQILNTN